MRSRWERCWTREQACARLCCTAAGLLEKSWDGALADGLRCDKNNPSTTIHCAARRCNLQSPRHLFVRPFSSLPAGMAQCLFTHSPSRAALHLRGAYTGCTDLIPEPSPLESQTRTWMRGGHAETPIYGWPWPSDNQTLWPHDWPSTETMVRRYCLSLLLYLIVLTSRATLYPTAFTTSTQHLRELPFSLCIPFFCVLARPYSHYCHTT